ncbi:hypothetical protein STEG23_021331 [Scotinomys teguina]
MPGCRQTEETLDMTKTLKISSLIKTASASIAGFRDLLVVVVVVVVVVFLKKSDQWRKNLSTESSSCSRKILQWFIVFLDLSSTYKLSDHTADSVSPVPPQPCRISPPRSSSKCLPHTCPHYQKLIKSSQAALPYGGCPTQASYLDQSSYLPFRTLIYLFPFPFVFAVMLLSPNQKIVCAFHHGVSHTSQLLMGFLILVFLARMLNLRGAELVFAKLN